MIFDKDVNIIQLGKDTFFNQWCIYFIGDLMIKMVNFTLCIIYHNFLKLEKNMNKPKVIKRIRQIQGLGNKLRTKTKKH